MVPLGHTPSFGLEYSVNYNRMLGLFHHVKSDNCDKN